MRLALQWFRYVTRDPWDIFDPRAVARWPVSIQQEIAERKSA